MLPVHFQDDQFPPRDLDWHALSQLIGPAAAALAKYSEILDRAPNPDVLIDHLSKSEAVYSSRIEGTQSSISDLFEFEATAGLETKNQLSLADDVVEVLNYKLALAKAESLMQERPLSQTVIRKSHQVLMQYARGQNKNPGEFRTIPVWIGSGNRDTARFVPIAAEKIRDAISALDRYINEDTPEDKLVRMAIIHAQFEAVHPFLDGNGRIGRLMIPLYLWQRGLIRRPIFYMSPYLERYRQEYYDSLLSIWEDGGWMRWCQFFLRGVIAQSQASIKKIDRFVALQEECRDRWSEILNSRHSALIHNWAFAKPIFSGRSFVKSQEAAKAKIAAGTARKFINKLRDIGEFTELRPPAGRSSGLYKFSRLVDLLEQEDEF